MAPSKMSSVHVSSGVKGLHRKITIYLIDLGYFEIFNINNKSNNNNNNNNKI
jgi:hypothetical protein